LAVAAPLTTKKPQNITIDLFPRDQRTVSSTIARISKGRLSISASFRVISSDAARNAIAQAPPQQRQDLLGTLLNALGGSGGGLGAIASTLGLGTTDPSRMSGDDAVRLLNYTRQQRPELLQQTVQEKPWFVKAMGNPIVMGALGMAAMKLLGQRRT